MKDTIRDWLTYKSLIARDEWNPKDQMELLDYIDEKKSLWLSMGLNAYDEVPTDEQEKQFLSKKNKQIIMKKHKVYLASGWFSVEQEKQLTKLEELLNSFEWLDVVSPRKIFVCPPDAPRDVQDRVFDGNVHHIKTANFIIDNTTYRDIGTIWEAGAAYAFGTPIVYFCENLPPGAKFNLMLSRSGVKVCTSFEQLKNYLERCAAEGKLIVEPYDKEIE